VIEFELFVVAAEAASGKLMPTTLASLAPADSRALALPVPPIAMVGGSQVVGLIGAHGADGD